ncbi:hypothetical protein MMC18_009554 [Xylographa bjoerkii]|nr:hypothetical protein [Xylographa bjoerkii]
MKDRFDKGVNVQRLQPGDLVMRELLRKSHKLSPRWKGPIQIMKEAGEHGKSFTCGPLDGTRKVERIRTEYLIPPNEHLVPLNPYALQDHENQDLQEETSNGAVNHIAIHHSRMKSTKRKVGQAGIREELIARARARIRSGARDDDDSACEKGDQQDSGVHWEAYEDQMIPLDLQLFSPALVEQHTREPIHLDFGKEGRHGSTQSQEGAMSQECSRQTTLDGSSHETDGDWDSAEPRDKEEEAVAEQLWREHQEKFRSSRMKPEKVESRRAYRVEYQSRPGTKEKDAAYEAGRRKVLAGQEERKAHAQECQRRPEVKARRALAWMEKNKRPGEKEKKRAWMKAYRERPEVKERKLERKQDPDAMAVIREKSRDYSRRRREKEMEAEKGKLEAEQDPKAATILRKNQREQGSQRRRKLKEQKTPVDSKATEKEKGGRPTRKRPIVSYAKDSERWREVARRKLRHTKPGEGSNREKCGEMGIGSTSDQAEGLKTEEGRREGVGGRETDDETALGRIREYERVDNKRL